MSALLVGYARCSTDQQDLTAQRDGLLGLGVEAERIYVDHGLTGTNRERPGLREALAACRAGDTLVVTKLDRLGRDSIDVQQTVTMFKEKGVRLVVLQLGNLDLTSSTGELTVKVLAAVADFERDLIIERTKAGQERAKAEGKHMGRPAKTTQEQRQEIAKALERGETVSALARLYGVSRATIAGMKAEAAGQGQAQ